MRDELLSVLDAGRTEIVGLSYPLPLDLTLALVVNCEAPETTEEHELRASVAPSENECSVTGLRRPFVVVPNEVAGALNFPLTLDLSPLELPALGAYDVRVFLDDECRAELSIRAYQGG